MQKSRLIALLVFAAFAGLAFASADSLRVRQVDWLDAEGSSMYYGPCSDGDFYYGGVARWDLALGDSVLIWLPGSRMMMYVDAYNTTSIDTTIKMNSGTENKYGAAFDDSIFYVVGGVYIYSIIDDIDSLKLLSRIYTPFADFHYAVIEDSFLYTMNFGDRSLYCVNIADPESMFVYRTFHFSDYDGWGNDLEIIDGYAYITGLGLDDGDYPDDGVHPSWIISKIDMINSAESELDSTYTFDNRFLGSIASNSSLVFYINTELSDYSSMTGWTYTVGETHLGVWGQDYSYTWSDLSGEGCFGIDAISDILLAVGFEHGFSILNYSDLDNIREVAYYRNPDSTMDFTHFALKDNRLYAMAHPRRHYARLYMFAISDSVIDGLFEALVAVPARIGISAYPNPFNSSVEITVGQTFLSVQNGQTGMSDLPVTIEIYDLQGHIVGANGVRPMDEGRMPYAPTNHTFIWKPDKSVSSGIYLVQARIQGGQTITKRVVYLK